MAAIDLTRLNKQIETLKEAFAQPAEFRLQLHAVLQFYHRYAHRKQKDSVPISFMQAYDLPEQILPQIANGLSLRARQDVNETLAVVDELWLDDHFEARDLAAHLIGQVPVSASQEIYQRLTQWVSVPTDRAVVRSIFTKSSQRLRAEAPKGWVDFVGSLLASSSERAQNHGLYALSLLATQSDSDDLPQFFHWIRPFIQSDQNLIQSNLSLAVAALARRSPTETAYILKEVMSDTDGSGIERRVRSYLPFFEAELGQSLQNSLRIHQNRTRLGL